jgi:hypothetical protein
MRRLTVTQHTVTCPIHDCAATLQVGTDLDAAPSRRYRKVLACSLVSSAAVTSTRSAGFPDATPPVPYLCSADWPPRHPTGVTCAKPCLRVLNAAEAGPPLACSSGVADGLDLIRQTQSPGMMRVLWMHSF